MQPLDGPRAAIAELDQIAAVLGHGFLLESPVQIVRFSHPHLSTRRGALQSGSTLHVV